ncbi:dockerin type I repeat-containing protein [Erysipelothrix sp. Poltava]|nr:dockerin type I repeat-containing protein [Erysipelothrix sp. Poltava]
MHKETNMKRGDVNGDGKISLIDLAMVKSHLLGNSKLSGDSFARADVNGDGKAFVIRFSDD